ncbi:alpha/beta hydrolase-fold protein [Robbsia sp. KACC 23696]|uniref:alpha/beta hydrolase n=1 Tax=Robbsia sp. KACC 23696 TaxID=3149231 RepID=UPI00325BDD21
MRGDALAARSARAARIAPVARVAHIARAVVRLAIAWACTTAVPAYAHADPVPDTRDTRGVSTQSYTVEARAAQAAMQALLPNTTSFVVRKAGHAYRVWLYTPDARAANGHAMPLLVLLDGNATFPIALQAARLQERLIGPLVIAAIAPDDDSLFDAATRYRDFTTQASDTVWGVPTFGALRAHDDAARIAPSAGDRSGGPDARVPTGGASAFRDIIGKSILPEIERRAAIDTERTTLFGHSLGGFFVLDTARHDRCLFSRYIAASPSLWWNDRELLRETDHPAPSACRTRPVMLQAGGSEQTLAPDASPARIERVRRAAMLDNVKAMAAMLQQWPDLYTLDGPHLYPDGNHVSYLPAALSEAVRYATPSRAAHASISSPLLKAGSTTPSTIKVGDT